MSSTDRTEFVNRCRHECGVREFYSGERIPVQQVIYTSTPTYYPYYPYIPYYGPMIPFYTSHHHHCHHSSSESRSYEQKSTAATCGIILMVAGMFGLGWAIGNFAEARHNLKQTERMLKVPALKSLAEAVLPIDKSAYSKSLVYLIAISIIVAAGIALVVGAVFSFSNVMVLGLVLAVAGLATAFFNWGYHLIEGRHIRLAEDNMRTILLPQG